MLDLLGSRRLQLLLTALVHIAAANAPLSGKRLAERLNCPRRYLESDLQTLVQQGVLESRRGAAGGYVLAVNPQRISLLHLLRCLNHETKAGDLRGCPLQERVVRPALQKLQDELKNKLGETTLAGLLANAEAEGLLRLPPPTPDFCI